MTEGNTQHKKPAGFWSSLPRPFFALAPMADVTDTAFRRFVAKHSRHGELGGGPDVFWTEFVSTDGLLSPGRDVLLRDLEFTQKEHPIVAQIFGSDPEKFREIAKLCNELGFDGIDINAGCPDRNICKQGAGSALIQNKDLAVEIIRATKEGAEGIPVSIKTRIGWSTDETEEWIGKLLTAGPAVITIHARTRKELSKVPPRFETVAHAVELAQGTDTLIVANGGIRTYEDGERIAKETGCDGIMMGKAIFGNPWLFDRNRPISTITIKERLNALLEHTELFLKHLGDIKNFAIMKKHYKAYCHGFPGAKELRIQLMEAESYDEVKEVVQQWMRNNTSLYKEVPDEEYIV